MKDVLISMWFGLSGMHDPTKGNFWFGRKYFYRTGGDFHEVCPNKLTQGDGVEVLNNKGQVEENFKLECQN